MRRGLSGIVHFLRLMMVKLSDFSQVVPDLGMEAKIMSESLALKFL